MNKLNFSLSIIALFVSISAIAQKPTPFTEKTADISKIKTILDFPAEGRTSKNGTGYSANVDLINPKPKKVALISFYLYDPACGDASKSNNGVTATYSAAIWRTPDALAQTHIDGFYKNSIESLKKGFKEYGIDLLTPSEFLNTDEKKDFYYEFNQESGKKEKTERTQIGGYVQATVSTIKICPTDEGYRPFFVDNEPVSECQSSNYINTGIGGANRKMTSSLGYELAKGLGVDAVVVCYIVTRKPSKKKEDYVVDAVNLFMFGPNPVSSNSEDKNRGQFYCGTRFFAKQLLFSDSKSNVTSYDNVGNVMTALSEKMGNWVINKAKK
ncbi:MAG TPA: hypothetical protein DDX39_02740 [Bacteroidales bacterium]|nr:MAG: hypothetical protein A2W98_03755 [Bacteroidetes bacterium GWF2_33_38]OFY91680.1 MAG: hypothetical protein A2236_12385 [Bacteroidetes bacterium RIFOXYA2_FULL_33_7]HBF87534.1 hypothetical protein [Bacteroidales bacterium]